MVTIVGRHDRVTARSCDVPEVSPSAPPGRSQGVCKKICSNKGEVSRWLCALAGPMRHQLGSNNRERLGDMVETALGVCRLIGEYTDVLAKYLGDPNSMSNRMENSLRMFMDADQSRHFTFGVNRPSRDKKHKWIEYSQRAIEISDQFTHPETVLEDILGPGQTRKVFTTSADSDSMDEEAPMQNRTCKECNNGKTVAKCSCDYSTSFRFLFIHMSI